MTTSAGEVKVGASIGVAIFGGCTASTEKLFKVADQRLYAAKHAGKNTWRGIENALQEDIEEQQEVERVRHARSLAEAHGTAVLPV